MQIWSIPEPTASSITYWITGRSTIGSISFGTDFVTGRNRVPYPAAGITAFRTRGAAAISSHSREKGKRRPRNCEKAKGSENAKAERFDEEARKPGERNSCFP